MNLKAPTDLCISTQSDLITDSSIAMMQITEHPIVVATSRFAAIVSSFPMISLMVLRGEVDTTHDMSQYREATER